MPSRESAIVKEGDFSARRFGSGFGHRKFCWRIGLVIFVSSTELKDRLGGSDLCIESKNSKDLIKTEWNGSGRQGYTVKDLVCCSTLAAGKR